MNRKLLIKAALGLVGLLVFAGLTGLLLREPITAAGEVRVIAVIIDA